MRVEVLADDAIVVELTADDMKNLNITYEEMDYSKVETKRVIWTVLSRAGKTIGREINTSGRLLVEAMQRETGGCLLFFSVEHGGTNRNRKYLLKKSDYIACDFENADVLFCCAERLKFSELIVESKLYRSDGRYRLIVRSRTTGTGLLKPCLAEFGKIVGEGAAFAAHTAEHWHCIAEENAVGLLSSGRGAS